MGSMMQDDLARSNGFPPRGYALDLIQARERALKNPMPDQIKRLYAAIDPETWRAVFGERNDYLNLLSLDDAGWAAENGWASAITETENAAPEWRTLDYFAFGHLIHGDEILFCPKSPRGQGTIIMADHEADDAACVLADDLASWLNRLMNFGGVEYAYLSGDLGSLTEARQREFLTDHKRLNPGIEWIARHLMSLDCPNGHPRGYHHWVGSKSMLIPIAEAGAVKRAELDNPTPTDIQSLANGSALEDLIISNGLLADLSPIASLPLLNDLSLYDLGKIDVAPLARAASLERLRILRTRVTNLAALAGAPKLKYLEIGGVPHGADDLKTIRCAHPNIQIEVT
jgi:hypothetical protein